MDDELYKSKVIMVHQLYEYSHQNDERTARHNLPNANTSPADVLQVADLLPIRSSGAIQRGDPASLAFVEDPDDIVMSLMTDNPKSARQG
jgi:hypothetical protein